MKKTGFVDSNNNYIDIPYYKINDFARIKCLEYINESVANKKMFDEVSSNYDFFDPYLDFLLCGLDYVMINPLDFTNTIAYFDNFIIKVKEVDHLSNDIDSLKKENGRYIIFTPSSGYHVAIKDFDICDTKDGIIMPDGRFIILNRGIWTTHELLAEQVLNQFLIQDKDIYYDYLNYVKTRFGHSLQNIPMPSEMLAIDYLTNRLGYIRYCTLGNSATYIYNSAKLTDKTRSIIEKLNKNPNNIDADMVLKKVV